MWSTTTTTTTTASATTSSIIPKIDPLLTVLKNAIANYIARGQEISFSGWGVFGKTGKNRSALLQNVLQHLEKKQDDVKNENNNTLRNQLLLLLVGILASRAEQLPHEVVKSLLGGVEKEFWSSEILPQNIIDQLKDLNAPINSIFKSGLVEKVREKIHSSTTLNRHGHIHLILNRAICMVAISALLKNNYFSLEIGQALQHALDYKPETGKVLSLSGPLKTFVDSLSNPKTTTDDVVVNIKKMFETEELDSSYKLAMSGKK